MVKWFHKYFLKKYTLACDLAPFWGPHNEREQLFHYKGLFWTRHEAKKWCRIHSNGQARVIPGWIYWPEEEPKKEMS